MLVETLGICILRCITPLLIPQADGPCNRHCHLDDIDQDSIDVSFGQDSGFESNLHRPKNCQIPNKQFRPKIKLPALSMGSNLEISQTRDTAQRPWSGKSELQCAKKVC
jgi:hypothetical protein